MKANEHETRRAPHSAARAAKRWIDVAAALVGLTAAAPVLGAAALAVRAAMGPPVLFRHTRPGLRGEPFELLKLRTMRPPRPGENLEEDEGHRITRLGQVLRATSIDELPGLWNVLRGDMSLVGPRPLLMEYMERYTPAQARRHDVRPGLTGWCQINGRNARDWDTKLALDTWYVDNWSLGLDLRILARTPLVVLRREGISHHTDSTSPVFRGSSEARDEPASRPSSHSAAPSSDGALRR